MNIEITRAISRKAWLQALNVKGEADDSIKKQMDEAQGLLLAKARPKGIYRIMLRTEVKTCGFSVEKHLEGCRKVVVMGITLGSGIDELIRRTQITDMAIAVIMDSGASVLIEQLCDEFEENIRAEVRGHMTSRFSPGYGDFLLTAQEDMIRYIDGQRKIGLNITRDALMVPRKSITAVMGIADHPVKGRLATCEECILREKCTLRKEGKFCGD